MLHSWFEKNQDKLFVLIELSVLVIFLQKVKPQPHICYSHKNTFHESEHSFVIAA